MRAILTQQSKICEIDHEVFTNDFYYAAIFVLEGIDEAFLDIMRSRALLFCAETNESAIGNLAVEARGVLRLIDRESKTLTIEQEPIARLSWPSMTMEYAFGGNRLIRGIKEGDEVEFSFVQSGRVNTLNAIKRVK
ncbi:MAG: copper-binding protein [Helicobacteraceae bacterium]|jgi:Cu/Ag efflux protein CusF|nr:copper-binding protein [Helicobacteraceae bacterium]